MPEGFLSHIHQHVKRQTGAIALLLVALLWIIFAVQMHQFFGGKLYIGLKEVVISRIWLIVLSFVGRYILFPRVRNKNLLQWSFILVFCVIIGVRISQPFHHTVNWTYFLLLFTDILSSSFFLACLAETIGGVFQYWRSLPDDAVKAIDEYRRNFGRDAFKLGLLLTLIMSLADYYFINFCLVDTELYSYILAVPVIGGGVSFFAVAFTKIQDLFQREINVIDLKLAPYLYGESHDTQNLADFLPHYQFLLLTRSYFNELKKPFISIKVIFWYLLFCGFIFLLPYMLGAVIEV